MKRLIIALFVSFVLLSLIPTVSAKMNPEACAFLIDRNVSKGSLEVVGTNVVNIDISWWNRMRDPAKIGWMKAVAECQDVDFIMVFQMYRDKKLGWYKEGYGYKLY